MTRRAVMYLRVSDDDSDTANQRLRLQDVADRAGWTITAIYEDEGISGAKGRDKRPQFDAMLKAASRREFDVVMTWAVDRLGRSLRDLVTTLEDLRASGIDLYIDQQALDTTTPSGRAMYQMLGVFAEFELAMLKARIYAGLARARKHGTRSGKPIGRPPLAKSKVAAIARDIASGDHTLAAIAMRYRIGEATVRRIRDRKHHV